MLPPVPSLSPCDFSGPRTEDTENEYVLFRKSSELKPSALLMKSLLRDGWSRGGRQNQSGQTSPSQVIAQATALAIPTFRGMSHLLHKAGVSFGQNEDSTGGILFYNIGNTYKNHFMPGTCENPDTRQTDMWHPLCVKGGISVKSLNIF